MNSARSVSELEDEVDNLYFAKPLIDLKDPSRLSDKYFWRFIEKGFLLLDKPKEDNYERYAQYLWQIVARAVENMKGEGFGPLKTLENHLEQYKDHPEVNWWNYKLEQLRQVFASVSKDNELQTIVERIKAG